MHSATPPVTARPDRFRLGERGLLLACLCVSLAGGCRTGRPNASLVQVTEDPAAAAGEIPAPQQRLATTRTGQQTGAEAGNIVTASAKTSSAAPTADGTAAIPAVLRQATDQESTRRPAAAKTTVATPESELPASKSTDPTPATTTPDPSKQPRTAASQPAGQSESAAGKSLGGLVSASLTDLSEGEAQPTGDDSALETRHTAQSPAQPAEPAETDSEPPPAKLAAASQPTDADESQPPAVPRRTVAESQAPHSPLETLQRSLADPPPLAEQQREGEGPSPSRIDAASQASDRATERQADVAASKRGGKADPGAQDKNVEGRPVSHASGKGTADGKTQLAGGTLQEGVSPKMLEDHVDEDALYAALLAKLERDDPEAKPAERERRQLVARYLQLLAGDPEAATEPLEGLGPQEQKAFRQQLQGLWTLIDPAGHPSSGRRITEALPKFRRGVRYLASATDSLQLANLEFCTEIEAYGQIKPFNGNRFNAGQQVILYCEVENFAADDRDGQFETRLQGTYDIYDASGKKVSSQLLPVDRQRSRNYLRDYFVAYQMYLPKDLPAGTYRLQLTIEDLVGKKYGQSDVPFEIR